MTELEPIKVNFLPGNPLSYTTTNIRVFRGDYELSSATGFVIRFGQIYALVTNWHVVSGINPATGKCLSSTGALPTRIECHVTLSKKLDNHGEELYFKPLTIDLFDGVQPIWLDENKSNAQNDYAVINLLSFVPELSDENVSLRSILGGRVVVNKGKATNPVHIDDVRSIYPSIGAEVFVLGYPRGITQGGVFPIWKRGSIASEPQDTIKLDGIDYKNVFYIDALTKAGMSGAPVICLPRSGDSFHTEDGSKIAIKEPEPYIIGVYAGREGITQEEYELSVGRVWKIGAVERLLMKFGSIVVVD
jgi:Trypsin-like peptidase domain